MVIDLIMLVLISSIFFIVVSSQMSHQATDAGVIRTKSVQIQRTLIALLNSQADNTTLYPNATVAELIGKNYCGTSMAANINNTVLDSMQKVNRPGYYFILTSCPEGECNDSKSFAVCSPEIESNFSCCVKTENINVAKLHLNLPSTCSYHYATVEMGIWPGSIEVEKC
ncbi:MAG: hypothetical protein PHC66_03215 [Candidatus Nanoarchaeia archaeon]|nr:hypothetical protein [Candidatus Nanoarchaeia archaeon]